MSEIRLEGQEPSGFEMQLTEALRRVDAPEGFAARVMEHAVPAKVVTMRPRFVTLRVRAWAGGAIAAMLTVGVFGAEQLHARHERAETALANQQFEAAMRVTDHALDQTRAQLERAGLKLGD